MKKRFVFWILLLVSFQAYGETKKTVCLNMIVKNESEVIERCLGSLKHLIDYWVIVDTGSSDGTQAIIQECLQDIPGELHERPWVDFAHNRNEALKYAKGKADYLLMIDADEVLEMEPSFQLPNLDKDFYYLTLRSHSDTTRATFIKNSLNWQWEGILHEQLRCDEAVSYEWLSGIMNICNYGGGARSKDPQKLIKDAQVLEKGLEKEPNNSRYAFYIGQSYYYAKDFAKAIRAFEKRISMPGDPQETFVSLYFLALCQKHLKMPLETVIQSLTKAYLFRPTRMEPLYHAAMLYRENGNPFLGYLIAKHALAIPKPQGESELAYTVYDFSILLEFANCALFSNQTKEGIAACEILLVNPLLPPEMKDQVQGNLNLARQILNEEQKAQ